MAASPRLGEASTCVAKRWRAIPSWFRRMRCARGGTVSRSSRSRTAAVWRCWLTVELIAAVALGGCALPGDEDEARSAVRHPPVVFVVFDEFPADDLLRPDGSIDAERFPNFAELASISTWFPNGHTVYDSTFKAVPAILDGRAPREGTAADVRSHKPSIFHVMDLLGYGSSRSSPRRPCARPTSARARGRGVRACSLGWRAAGARRDSTAGWARSAGDPPRASTSTTRCCRTSRGSTCPPVARVALPVPSRSSR